MIIEDFEKSMLALTAWREERHNGAPGILAVMLVVRNRLKAGWGNSYTQVISGFSPQRDMPDPRDPMFLQALQLADSIYDDTRKDTVVNGALYMFYEDKPRGSQLVAKVGTSEYYR
jgi:hypothetical protein